MSERSADERQPAHPGAADRDEVQRAPGRPSVIALRAAGSRRRISAATRSAASGRASPREAAAIRASRSRSASSGSDLGDETIGVEVLVLDDRRGAGLAAIQPHSRADGRPAAYG